MSVRTMARLFGRSPFVPLQLHLEKVADCVQQVVDLLNHLPNLDAEAIGQASRRISKLEHKADLVKNDIRNNLPRGLFMAIDRGQLLEILSLQDSIADRAEDIGILLSLKCIPIPESIAEKFNDYVAGNESTFHKARSVMEELDDLIESGFGGAEAGRVDGMIDDVAEMEHTVDIQQRDLMREIFALEDDLSIGEFYTWMRLLHEVAALSNLSEKLANRVRMLLTLK